MPKTDSTKTNLPRLERLIELDKKLMIGANLAHFRGDVARGIVLGARRARLGAVMVSEIRGEQVNSAGLTRAEAALKASLFEMVADNAADGSDAECREEAELAQAEFAEFFGGNK